MRKRVLGGLIALAVAFMGYAGFNAWIAFVPPKRPVSTGAVFTPECEAQYQTTRDFSRGMYCQARIGESQRLKQHPDVAVRQGEDLILFYLGRQIARLAPVPVRVVDDPDCDSYLLHKVLAVHDSISGRMAKVAQISCHRGEFEERFVVMPDGSRWIVSDAASSPDGKRIATGQNWPDFEVQNSRLTIVSWPDRKVVARFKQPCRVVEWQDNNQFTVTCIENLLAPVTAQHNWYIAYDAKVWRDGHGRWRMQATRWLQPQMQINDAGDLEYSPQFSLLPLPGFTAEQPS